MKESAMRRTRADQVVVPVLIVMAMSLGCAENEPEAEPEAMNSTVRAPQDAGQDGPKALIQPGTGVGSVRFGMTVEEMKETLGEPDIDATGISYMYAAEGIEVVFRDGKVHSIHCVDHIANAPEVRTCQYRTSEGIGIGSTESEVVSAYGEPGKRTPDALMYNDLGLRLELDNGQVHKIVALPPW
jgi:hypothetical protein